MTMLRYFFKGAHRRANRKGESISPVAFSIHIQLLTETEKSPEAIDAASGLMGRVGLALHVFCCCEAGEAPTDRTPEQRCAT